MAEAGETGATANSYEVLAKLAKGGMAEIFLARVATGGGVRRYVVLKRVIHDRALDEQFIRMFLDEARLSAHLQHPNIAQVFDVGELSDSHFFTMEYVHGETVRAMLAKAKELGRELPIEVVLTVIAGAAAGLHHAHERTSYDGSPLHIVHRDVSPSNLMVSYEGTVKVVDFGVAKAEHRLEETLTPSVKGKIGYLSPEQCRCQPLDRRSDIFSLGICMWEMLTVQRLYHVSRVDEIVTVPAPPPSSRRAGIPPELDAVVLKMLEKAPEDRYQTAEEALEAIEKCAVKLGVALSTTMLGRTMKDLFGRRPEPWLALEAKRRPTLKITLNARGENADLRADDIEALDADLAALAAARPSQEHTAYEKPPAPVTAVESARGLSARVTTPISSERELELVPPPPALPAPVASRKRPLVIATAIVAAIAVFATIGVMASRVASRSASTPTPPADAASATVAMAPSPADAASSTVVAASPPDAATAAPAPLDAAVIVDAAASVPETHVRPPPRPPVEEVCAKGPRAIGQGAARCAIAACQAKNTAVAQQWLDFVAKDEQPATRAACKQAGVDLCKINPLKCQF